MTIVVLLQSVPIDSPMLARLLQIVRVVRMVLELVLLEEIMEEMAMIRKMVQMKGDQERKGRCPMNLKMQMLITITYR